MNEPFIEKKTRRPHLQVGILLIFCHISFTTENCKYFDLTF